MNSLQKIANLVRDPNVTIDVTAFIVALLVSLTVAFAISFLYRFFYENRATGSQIHRSFLILGPSITALFIAIQYSLPLSLGLLGALSIIRFRTPIKEPEETGFIMFLCACSVVTATFHFLLLFALMLTITIGLAIARCFRAVPMTSKQDGIVLISYSCGERDEILPQLIQILNRQLPGGKLESFSQREGTATLQCSFRDMTTGGLHEMRDALSTTESVKALSFYFNKSSQTI
jgi:hypothetical protein